MSDTIDLARLEKLLAEATPGPWEYLVDGDWPMIFSSSHDEDGHRVPVLDLYHGGYDFKDLGWPLAANAALIAAAVTALPHLLSRISELESALRQCAEVLGHVERDGTDFDLSVDTAIAQARHVLGEKA